MIFAKDVYAAISVYKDIEPYSEADIMPFCQKGLDWVNRRLRKTVDPDNPLIKDTAVAMAHYFFFLCRLSDAEKYDSCKVGDVTYKRNLNKELEFEKQIKNQAIAEAAGILTDGGFYCYGG